MAKILSKIVEPTIIYTGDPFTIKIKVRRGLTYNELKEMTYDEVKEYSYDEVKGD